MSELNEKLGEKMQLLEATEPGAVEHDPGGSEPETGTGRCGCSMFFLDDPESVFSTVQFFKSAC